MKKDKKKTIAIAIVGVAVIAIVAVAAFFLQDRGEDTTGSKSSAEMSRETADGENMASDGTDVTIIDENINGTVESIDATVIEADPATLSTDDVLGFVPANDDSNGESEDGSASAGVTITLSDARLQAEGVGIYTGNFLEDGSDEPTENVAALLVKNDSDQMLQVGEITFQVNDSETATFFVTNLPAGASALVLEQNKRPYSEEDSYTYGNAVTGFMDTPSLEEDKFEIVKEDGKLTLKNKTGESYEKVYVYYKYKQLNGTYMGGITYRTPFENVAAGGEAEAIAGHFKVEGSEIVDVQIMEATE